MKLKHILILQNKIDLVKESQAKEQYEQILAFVQGEFPGQNQEVSLVYYKPTFCLASQTAHFQLLPYQICQTNFANVLANFSKFIQDQNSKASKQNVTKG